MHRKSHLLPVLPALAVAGALISCVTAHHNDSTPTGSSPVWPPPPDEPRIRYVRSIASPVDIGRGRSAWTRVVGLVTGDSEQRETLLKPFGLALDEVGNLCVTDTGNNTVCYCDLARKQWHRWRAISGTSFASPVGIARKGGIFYVADSELRRIFIFGEDGREVTRITDPLQRPAGLTISGDSLVVADSQAHGVFVFSLRGQFRFRFGRRGLGPGEFNFPTHVGADPQGNLFVTDSLNSRVQIFDGSGKFISEIGSAGDAPGHFGRPKGVAVDSFGHLYVVDAVFDNVQVFDRSGQLLLNWGEGGTQAGQFGVPAGIAIGPDDQIYVADSYNHRIQVFKYLGN